MLWYLGGGRGVVSGWWSCCGVLVVVMLWCLGGGHGGVWVVVMLWCLGGGHVVVSWL